MSLRTQLLRSVFALPLLLIGLLALKQSIDPPARADEAVSVAGNTQLLLPMIMGPGLCQPRSPAVASAGLRQSEPAPPAARCRA